MRERGQTQPLAEVATAEHLLSIRDSTLARVITSHPERWRSQPTEDPIWGLARIVMAQQVSTKIACRLVERVKAAYPEISSASHDAVPDVNCLRAFGLPERRAQCCVSILQRSDEIRAEVNQGQTWEQALAGIKGIGPWTISVFRIMVLRHPDVLPLGDVGLERAITNVYGSGQNVQRLAEMWSPFRSVACWHLWRTLGNEQLG
jgi:DNA-3-methyladenine glycosylase II